MKRLGALLGLFVLAGCVGSPAHYQLVVLPRIQEANRQVAAIRTECVQTYKAKEVKSYREVYHCIHSRTRPILSDAGYPYMDLINLQFAYEAALAQRIDEGALSEVDADLLHAQLQTQINTEVQRRDLLTHQANLQAQQARQQSWDKVFDQINENIQRQADRNALRTMPPITCQQFGNMIQCR